MTAGVMLIVLGACLMAIGWPREESLGMGRSYLVQEDRYLWNGTASLVVGAGMLTFGVFSTNNKILRENDV